MSASVDKGRCDEAWRLECEARYWLKRVAEKGRAWWDSEAAPMIRAKRGQIGLDRLRAEMNRQRGNQ